jgi:hypothetical protein
MTPESVAGLAVGGTALELALVWIGFTFAPEALRAADERVAAQEEERPLVAAGAAETER